MTEYRTTVGSCYMNTCIIEVQGTVLEFLTILAERAITNLTHECIYLLIRN
jgi:hypothetical protein